MRAYIFVSKKTGKQYPTVYMTEEQFKSGKYGIGLVNGKPTVMLKELVNK